MCDNAATIILHSNHIPRLCNVGFSKDFGDAKCLLSLQHSTTVSQWGRKERKEKGKDYILALGNAKQRNVGVGNVCPNTLI